MPFHAAASLGLADAELEAAKKEAKSRGPGALLGIRYADDRICPRAKFETLQAEFGDSFEAMEIPGKLHSTLTEHLDEGALEKTRRFLRNKLQSSAAGA